MTTTLLETPTSAPTADPNAGHGVVLFDGSCRFCQFSVKLLRRLDWLKRLRFQDAHEKEKWPPSAVPLGMDKLMEEMHVVPPDRQRAYAGYRAFRWIAGRLPLLWPIVPLLFLPGVPWMGNQVYHWIARNRYKLVPCKDGVCELPRKKA
jgi:predicted DCC family thiol-disulfide oxidoreductase YuxK